MFTLPKTRHLWDRKGESLLKRKSFDKLGARGFGLKAACSGALLEIVQGRFGASLMASRGTYSELVGKLIYISQ